VDWRILVLQSLTDLGKTLGGCPKSRWFECHSEVVLEKHQRCRYATNPQPCTRSPLWLLRTTDGPRLASSAVLYNSKRSTPGPPYWSVHMVQDPVGGGLTARVSCPHTR
jgi:hypothetical protein